MTTTKLPLLERSAMKQVNEWIKVKAKEFKKKPSIKDLVARIVLLYGR
jgi:hypothetical protein